MIVLSPPAIVPIKVENLKLLSSLVQTACRVTPATASKMMRASSFYYFVTSLIHLHQVSAWLAKQLLPELFDHAAPNNSSYALNNWCNDLRSCFAVRQIRTRTIPASVAQRSQPTTSSHRLISAQRKHKDDSQNSKNSQQPPVEDRGALAQYHEALYIPQILLL